MRHYQHDGGVSVPTDGPGYRLLDELNGVAAPVDGYASGQSVLTQIRSYSAVRRLQACLTLLDQGRGATLTGAIDRSLLASALQATWERATAPPPQSPLVASLPRERSRIRALSAKHHLTVPNIDRWLHPAQLPQLEQAVAGMSYPPDRSWGTAGVSAVAAVLGMSSAMAQIFDMAGHANYAGSWCTLAEPPHPVGYRAAPRYRAIFTQVGCRSAVVASGSDHSPSVRSLMSEVTVEARRVHELPEPVDRIPSVGELRISGESAGACARVSFLAVPSLVSSLLEGVLAATDRFVDLLDQAPDPYQGSESSNLRTLLPYLTTLDTVQAVQAAIRGYLPHEIAPIGARMLLEAAGRAMWMSAPGEGSVSTAELWRRYVAVADDETARRATLRRALAADGVSSEVVSKLLEPLPKGQVQSVDRRRTPAHERSPRLSPPFEQMLLLGQGFPEEGWLDLAYSLLSQIAHSTGLGLLHCLARESSGGERALSEEMLALAADVACLGAARAVAPLARLICYQQSTADPLDWRRAATRRGRRTRPRSSRALAGLS